MEDDGLLKSCNDDPVKKSRNVIYSILKIPNSLANCIKELSLKIIIFFKLINSRTLVFLKRKQTQKSLYLGPVVVPVEISMTLIFPSKSD